MATIGMDPNGFRRILFNASDGTRKTIRLGKATAKQAEAFMVRVEHLVMVATGGGGAGAITGTHSRHVGKVSGRLPGESSRQAGNAYRLRPSVR